MKQAIAAMGEIAGAEQALRLLSLQQPTNGFSQGPSGTGDRASVSPEAAGVDEGRGGDEVARQLQTALWNARLRQDLGALHDPQARDGGASAKEKLAADYGKAQQLEIRIDPGLDAEIRKALGKPSDEAPSPDGGRPTPSPDGGGPTPGPDSAPTPSPDGGPRPSCWTRDDQPDGNVDPQPPRPDADVRNLDTADNHDGRLNTRDSGAWGDRDRDLLRQALAPSKEGFQHDLITSWAQGPYGNCVSVAEIKAGMATYGNRMFDRVAANERGGYDVQMQDGHSVSLSGQEMSMAKHYSGFRGAPSEELAFAHLAFAAEAKRAQEMGHEGARTYGQALSSLNNGEYAGNVGRFLGLSQHMRRTANPYAQNAPPSFGANRVHEMFVTRGNVDYYGSKSHSTHGMSPNSFYHFAPRPFPSQTVTTRATPPTTTSQPTQPTTTSQATQP